VSKESETSFNKMAMFAFSNTVLLRGMRTRHPMRDANTLKIAMKAVILTTPVRLDSFDFSIEETFNMSLKSIENLLDIRLMFQEIYPTEARIVINKANIVGISTRRRNSRSPNIRMN
jgi:hypothetical protein